MGAARNALGIAQQSSLSGPALINKPTLGWSSAQLLVQDIGLLVSLQSHPNLQVSPYHTRPSCHLNRLDSARGHRFPTSGLYQRGHSFYLSDILAGYVLTNPGFTVRNEVNHRSAGSISNISFYKSRLHFQTWRTCKSASIITEGSVTEYSSLKDEPCLDY